ncbi:MAG: hypothetical protein Q7R49_03740 [Candidatus Daviesbacteria bacterium]|nr:hypothetical protein [Candidatus Daviesbacteria bacterium]
MDNTNQAIPPEIRTFLENLLTDANITPLDEAMKEEMIGQLYVKLDSFVMTTVVENLPPEYMDEFIRLNEENRPKEEIDTFMADKIPNSQDVFAKAFLDFRDLYLGEAGVAGNPQAASN